ncbi:MAG: universal stress protein [Thermogemmatispora sp.]|uniref:universal stress protein n=1 Tax=Thermogemmatispora sp. TaxID=1968838 RepID=UPI0019EE4A1D|nr:universal stress protein [Thermogemmatispora sp.]MBE3567053.1 universal stress protein [Thermogemmatispora sp.]
MLPAREKGESDSDQKQAIKQDAGKGVAQGLRHDLEHERGEVFTAKSGRLRLLVPLDGSRLAEAVLPSAAALAQRYQGEILLLHILEQHPPAQVHGERHLRDVAEARVYLEEVAARLRAEDLMVTVHVHENREQSVARGIVEHVQELQSDLVVMCTHGNGGVRDLLFGSIAQQVLQRGPCPIWLVQPRKDGSAPPFKLRRILVPLDGTPEHEPGLPAAIALARTFGAELRLVFVIPTLTTLAGEQAVSGTMLPATMRAVLDLAEQGARSYLKQVAEECQSQGVKAQGEVLRGETVLEVVKLLERQELDLVVLASHGRTGLDALLSGSVAPRLVGRVSVPLLLVRATTL